jgi:Fungal chitosanase of glycosyl hydrolase group 75
MRLALRIVCVVVLLGGAGVVVSSGSPVSHCGKTRLFNRHGVVFWSTSGRARAIFYRAGFAIDADGAFRAYHPKDQMGLDALVHAGHPGNWWALVTDNEKRSGRPVVQGDDDPAPGYYVSTTALYDPDNPNVRDPRRYVDAETIPYIALHPQALHFARLGDFATVVNLQNGKTVGAVVADESTANVRVGEGSIALANALGIDSDPRFGGKAKGVAYIVYPRSGNGRPRELQEIANNSERLFEAWGGIEKLTTCSAE